MEKILALPSDVIDQIAAGEVVERPAHLVKELVENSLDAGATKISIEYRNGGRYVKVTDDGAGISENQLDLALDRHATSKIKNSDDLWKLKSFGFRGEALASIAAVSRLTLISKPKLQKSAGLLKSAFGNRESIENVGGSEGTSILIEELFANVPARLKFMKSAAAENSRIRLSLKALALAHPQVELKVLQEGELIYFWPAQSTRLDRVRQVLEIDSLYEGQAERGNVIAHAIFTDPKTVQKTSKDLWFFAQNRWIQDRSLQAAVMEAYRHLLMHGEYPTAVVWVETNPEEIDVNIHPSKSQVKFADASLAFRAVQASIRDVLEQAPWLPKATIENTVQNFSPNVNQSFEEEKNLAFVAPELERAQYAQKSWKFEEPASQYKVSSSDRIEKAEFWSKLQVLGQSNLTYILTQSQTELVIVDQHAAHERVNFEKLMSAWKGGKIDVQDYLFPLAIDLSPDQVEALIHEKDLIGKLGISIESLGPSTIGVRSAPLLLKETALSTALQKMAFELVEHGGSFSLEKKIGDMLATMACHSSIRAGQALSSEEMHSLLQSMDEFPLSSFCPHGRPVSVNYPFAQLEKDFGRTV
jgi:DNA mismatch repair protein MutL